MSNIFIPHLSIRQSFQTDVVKIQDGDLNRLILGSNPASPRRGAVMYLTLSGNSQLGESKEPAAAYNQTSDQGTPLS